MSTDWTAPAVVSSQKQRPCCSNARAWEPAPLLRHGGGERREELGERSPQRAA